MMGAAVAELAKLERGGASIVRLQSDQFLSCLLVLSARVCAASELAQRTKAAALQLGVHFNFGGLMFLGCLTVCLSV